MSTLRKLISAFDTPFILILTAFCIGLVGVLTGPTLWYVSAEILIASIFLIGMSAFVSNTGIMSFGHVGFMAIGAYAAAYMTIPTALKQIYFDSLPAWLLWLQDVSLPFVPAIIVSGLVAAILGACTSFVIARLDGLQSGIATLALLIIVHNVIKNWTAVTRGTSSMLGIPTLASPMNIVGFVSLAILVVWGYSRSSSALKLRASREDYWSAEALGINVYAHRVISWVISSFVCGIAGALYATLFGTFSADTFFLGITFEFLVMIVVGGYLSLSGAFCGAIIIGIVQELLRRLQDGAFTGGHALPAGLSGVILGLILLVTLITARSGIFGTKEICVRGFK